MTNERIAELRRLCHENYAEMWLAHGRMALLEALDEIEGFRPVVDAAQEMFCVGVVQTIGSPRFKAEQKLIEAIRALQAKP